MTNLLRLRVATSLSIVICCVLTLVLGRPPAAKAQSATDQQTITNMITSAFPSGTTVPFVVFAQNYAVAVAQLPDGQSAREILFVNTGSWTELAGVGGAFDTPDFQNFSVPSDVTQTLMQEITAQG